jgi:hypothetical protein
MTTIGQTSASAFYDGAGFGPIKWSGAELAKTAPSPVATSTIVPFAKESPWVTAGVQNWPPLQDKVTETGVSATGESDTIDLTALPDLTVKLNPSGCQHYKGSAHTTDFKASLVGGSPGNVPVYYGWKPAATTQSVPNSTLNNEYGLYIGTKANVSDDHFAFGGGAGGKGFSVGVTLLYTDATGALSNRWGHAGVSADDEVTLGSTMCPS